MKHTMNKMNLILFINLKEKRNQCNFLKHFRVFFVGVYFIGFDAITVIQSNHYPMSNCQYLMQIQPTYYV